MTLKRSRKRLTISPLILLAATSCMPMSIAGVETPTSVPAVAPAPEPQPDGPPAAPEARIVPALHAARPFDDEARSAADAARSLQCLTATIYYEAGSESLDGQRAVAQVVLNRVRHPAFPNSVCGVVYQGSQRATGCQFTFTCDGSSRRRPDRAGWERARTIASAALDGAVFAPVGQATHYHTRDVHPYWSHTLTRAATIGAHIFYRWRGTAGEASAFDQHYAGIEPFPGGARRASRPPAATVWKGDGGTVTIHRAGASRPMEAREQQGVRVHQGLPPQLVG